MKTGFSTFLAGMLILLGGGCGQQGYHLNARFHNVHQLKYGDPVVMAGVRVGHVKEISLDLANATFIVTMEIRRSVVVKTDGIATIKPAASAGKSVIALDGGSPRGVALREGQFLMATEQPSY
jgi:phospholipid/cholesterol/gamma-HCH transport system substrate-binding protein